MNGQQQQELQSAAEQALVALESLDLEFGANWDVTSAIISLHNALDK